MLLVSVNTWLYSIIQKLTSLAVITTVFYDIIHDCHDMTKIRHWYFSNCKCMKKNLFWTHVSVSTHNNKTLVYFVLQIRKKNPSKYKTGHQVTISKWITKDYIVSLICSNRLVYQIGSSVPYVILNYTKHFYIFGVTCFCLKWL